MSSLLSRITINPEICHGRPVIRDLRYPVESMMEYLAALDSWHENYRREPRPPRPVNPHAPVIVK